MKRITEAKDVTTYKKLLRALGDFSDMFPATGVSGLFKGAVENGINVLPSDKQALAILNAVMSEDKAAPGIVHELLNLRFADLPIELRPVFKNARCKEVAFWQLDGKLYDRVVALINFKGSGKKGAWSDLDGNKVTLLDLTKTEDERDDKGK